MRDPKPRPNQKVYLRALAAMTPSEKAAKVFELSDAAKARFREGLRLRFPHLAEAQLHAIYLERLARCHNKNY